MNNQHILGQVRADLAAFADTHSLIEVDATGATWRRHNRELKASFAQGADSLPTVGTNGVSLGYRDFLASPEMADLTALAEAMFWSLSEQKHYVESRATTGEDEEPAPVEGLLKSQVANLPFGSTRVIFLRGAAGAGKTCALRQLARRQAERYVDHGATSLYLYIDAQARSLARLDDAVALVLQDLNARFTYRALAPLTRHGLIVPIIDGFDELLGTGEGTDALDALSQFLARLQGRGATLASARSTYFDFQKFRSRAARLARASNSSFELVSVDLQPWSDAEMQVYLDKAAIPGRIGASTPREALEKLRKAYTVEGGNDLFATPFFLAAAADSLVHTRPADSPRPISSATRPIARIIDSFIDREVEKQRTATNDVLLDRSGHKRFLEMLAEEMWWQERRELDSESVRAAAELLGESEGMAERELRGFAERATSYAFLHTERNGSTGGQPKLAFAHEVYSAFFLARFVARTVGADDNVTELLGRSKMGPTVGAEFGECVKEGRVELDDVLGALARRRVPVPSRETNRENAATLYAGILQHAGAVSELALKDAAFIGSDLRGTRATNVRVADCEFVDVQFAGAEWTFESSKRSTYTRLHVDRDTSLSGLRLEAGTDLVGVATSEGRMEYERSKVMAICQLVGIGHEEPAEEHPVVSYSEEAEKVIDELHKFLRCAERLYHISDGDLKRRGFWNRRTWWHLQELMLQHDLLEIQAIQRKGADNKVRLLAFPPNRIAEGEAGVAEPRIREFWETLRALG